MRHIEDEIEELANFLDEDDEIQAKFERDMRRRANTLLSDSACIGHGDEARWRDEGTPESRSGYIIASEVAPITAAQIREMTEIMRRAFHSRPEEIFIWPSRGLHG
jgi:hypothetical protein